MKTLEDLFKSNREIIDREINLTQKYEGETDYGCFVRQIQERFTKLEMVNMLNAVEFSKGHKRLSMRRLAVLLVESNYRFDRDGNVTTTSSVVTENC